MHELYLFARLGVPTESERWADLGCGVGGPMRQAVRFGDGKITVYGINNSEHQVQRCRQLNEQEGLSGKTIVVCSSFGNIQFDDESVDKVYAIEATCHASDLNIPYSEAFRILKPGGIFASYEWVITDRYDADNKEMAKNLALIQEGCSLVRLNTIEDCRKALKNSGFEILEMEDLALKAHIQPKMERPWYSSLAVDYSIPVLDKFFDAYQALFGKFHLGMMNLAEKVGAVRSGSSAALRVLQKGREGLVESGRMGTYTPMMLVLARKPK